MKPYILCLLCLLSGCGTSLSTLFGGTDRGEVVTDAKLCVISVSKQTRPPYRVRALPYINSTIVLGNLDEADLDDAVMIPVIFTKQDGRQPARLFLDCLHKKGV